MPRMLTVKAVAAALGLSDERVRQLIHAGQLGAARRVGARKLLIAESAVMEYLRGLPVVHGGDGAESVQP